jgi:hypothetical protein
MSLTISASKSKVMLFTIKHERPPILVRTGSYVLPQTTSFKYLGIFFNAGLRWCCHAKYVRRRCLYRDNVLKSVAGVSYRAHPSCLILLYKGLIKSVLKCGSVCYTNMAMAHMLGLERVQYRVLRIALCLMGSTPNTYLGVFSGIPPLAEGFAYLNFRCLVATFYRLGHPLRKKLGVLGTLIMSRCIKGYSDVLSLDIVLSESFTRFSRFCPEWTKGISVSVDVSSCPLFAVFLHPFSCCCISFSSLYILFSLSCVLVLFVSISSFFVLFRFVWLFFFRVCSF